MRTKKIKKTKKRVRFLSLDYYRTLVTGKCTPIEGIHSYWADDEIINVHFENGYCKTYIVNEGEYQLKQAVKMINTYLGGKTYGA